MFPSLKAECRAHEGEEQQCTGHMAGLLFSCKIVQTGIFFLTPFDKTTTKHSLFFNNLV